MNRIGDNTVIDGVNASSVFDSADFIENCTYGGHDLGAVIHGDKTTFTLWAPTADRVVLNLFDNGTDGDSYASVELTRREKGVWN